MESVSVLRLPWHKREWQRTFSVKLQKKKKKKIEGAGGEIFLYAILPYEP